MIDQLDRVVDDISTVHSKLVLLIGQPGTGKSKLLWQLAKRKQAPVLNIGTALARELLTVPSARRHLYVAEIFRGLADEVASQGILLVDNIELLFDRTLKLSPLDLLRRHAQARRVIAVWPGELRDNRLVYAETGHPEYRDYAIDGLVPFTMH